jgi:hypothetical protein
MQWLERYKKILDLTWKGVVQNIRHIKNIVEMKYEKNLDATNIDGTFRECL